jgi:hypothetical protein
MAVDEKKLEEAIKALLVKGKLPCPAALKLSKDLNVSTKAIGDMANKLEIKIAGCQLGCFK